MPTIPAYVELSDDLFVSAEAVTGRQLAEAVQRAAQHSSVVYHRRLLNLQRAFRRARGTDSEIVGSRLSFGAPD